MRITTYTLSLFVSLLVNEVVSMDTKAARGHTRGGGGRFDSDLIAEQATFWERVLQPDMSLSPTPGPMPTQVPAPMPGPAPAQVPAPTSVPAPGPTPPSATLTMLKVTTMGPGAAFTDQDIEFTIEVSNIGTTTATNVVVENQLPMGTSFVSSNPPGTVSGGVVTIPIGDIPAGGNVEVMLTIRAPSAEGTITNQVSVKSDNAPDASDSEEVQIGTISVVTGAVASGGTGLRNRPNGTIFIEGIPTDGVVTRAVLVWAILYSSSDPVPNFITFNGSNITADLTATISENLCWGDDATIGYAADVTGLVSGNGEYTVEDAENGEIRVDDEPSGTLPYTDGASLFVFYGGPGLNDQVIADFTYSAQSNEIDSNPNTRSLSGINSIGGSAILTLAGPDGQNNAGEEVRISVSGAGTLNFESSWDGSAPQLGPDFAIGNLWDHDFHDVSSILPAGQTTLNILLGTTPQSNFDSFDCTGLSAVVLQVEQ